MYYESDAIKNLYRIFDQNERKDYLRLDLNENPGGLPQDFIDKVLSDVTPQFVAQYPETLHFSQVLADHLGTDISHLCLVNGSAEGIRYIIQAFTAPRGRIVGVVPSYFMFQVYSQMYDREFVGVPYEADLSMNISNILQAMTDDTQLLILLNPNNPMGNVYSDEEFETILAEAKRKQITLLIDEAYHYFYPKTFAKYALQEEHVFVTRTFSKLFSINLCRFLYLFFLVLLFVRRGLDMRSVYENNAWIYHLVVYRLVQDMLKYLLRQLRWKSLTERIAHRGKVRDVLQ